MTWRPDASGSPPVDPTEVGLELPGFVEQFAALHALGCRHGFVGRVTGVDVDADRTAALGRLDGHHRHAREALALGSTTFVTAEQVHGNAVAVIAAGEPVPPTPIAGMDALVTNRRDVSLGIYVADCCAVYLVDPRQRVVGLAHSGKKGTELGITAKTLAVMGSRFGTRPEDVTIQLSPCIRPPWYEIDFARQIIEQCRAAGVLRVVDEGADTAAEPLRFYSYRREKGRTGRMLALLALD